MGITPIYEYVPGYDLKYLSFRLGKKLGEFWSTTRDHFTEELIGSTKNLFETRNGNFELKEPYINRNINHDGNV